MQIVEVKKMNEKDLKEIVNGAKNKDEFKRAMFDLGIYRRGQKEAKIFQSEDRGGYIMPGGEKKICSIGPSIQEAREIRLQCERSILGKVQ